MSELLTNGTFEAWTSATNCDDWTEITPGASSVDREAVEIHSGTYSVKFSAAADGGPYATQVVSLTAGVTYDLSYWLKTNATGNAEVNIKDVVDGALYLQDDGSWHADYNGFTRNDASWAQKEIYFTPGRTGDHQIIAGHTQTAGGISYFDDVSIEAVTPTANDEANIFNDGDFCYWTSATGSADWTEATAGASTITQYATSPFRGLYSCRITIDADDNSASISQSPTLIAFQHRLFFRHRESGAATVGYTIVDDTTGHYLQTDGTWAADTNTFEPAHADAWADHDLYFTAVSAGAHTITFLEGSLVTSETMDLDTVSLMQTGFASGSMGNVAMRGRR